MVLMPSVVSCDVVSKEPEKRTTSSMVAFPSMYSLRVPPGRVAVTVVSERVLVA